MSELRRLSLAATAFILLTAACDDGAATADDQLSEDTSGGSGQGSGTADAGNAGSGADSGGGSDTESGDTSPAEPGDDGAPCLQGSDCASGFCLTDEQGFPGGLCTVFDCTSRQDCFGVGTACLRGQFNGNLCVPLCVADSDCREGYECRGTGTGSFCYPAFANLNLDPVCASDFVAADDVTNFSFGSTSRLDRHRISFDVPEGATSLFVLAWDQGHTLVPDLIRTPTAGELQMQDYASYLFTPISLGEVSPVLLPGGPAYQQYVETGRYEMEFGTDGPQSEDLCYLLYTESESLSATGEALVVDLNFYFVGADGLTAETAVGDPAFARLIESFNSVYSTANVEVGEVRYFDVGGDILDRFQVIRDSNEVYELVRLSRQPGSTRDALLSANVFFIQGFAGQSSSVLGISTGIPGAAGVHGQAGTGLVFSAEYLRQTGNVNGPQLVGQVLAHELGHYLGLFHTTEQSGGQFDQLDDTERCSTIENGNLAACADYNNLMFPIAAIRNTLELSDGQVSIIRANPLTKPVGGRP